MEQHMHKIRAMRWHLTSLALLVVVAIGLLMTETSGTMAAKESGADGLMREGLQAYQRGAFDKALASWKQAAQGYEQQDKPMEQSRALVAAAQASEAMGQVTQALQQLEVALALAQKSQDKVWTATVQSSRSNGARGRCLPSRSTPGASCSTAVGSRRRASSP